MVTSLKSGFFFHSSPPSLDIQSSALLERLKALPLPPEVSNGTSFQEFPLSERIHNVEIEREKYKIRFYSDGLVLDQKETMEKFLQESLAKMDPALVGKTVIYMERKNKSTPQASPTKPQASQSPPKPTSSESQAGGMYQPKRLSQVKYILAVASGKGGVGKSTVSVNLATALSQQGYQVGLLDADIYGPSIPMMLGINEDPKVNAQNKIVPVVKNDIKVMSFGFFAGEESAVIWRGPMVMKALQQFFFDVDWGECDFLVIDLPPGTGDAQLTLIQSLQIDGAIIVTTPQNVALLDAYKAVAMFQKTNVPILGAVENMSTFHCPACSVETKIFGSGGADKLQQRFSLPILGHVPLEAQIREAGDSGNPLARQSGHPIRIRFSEIAEKVVHACVEKAK